MLKAHTTSLLRLVRVLLGELAAVILITLIIEAIKLDLPTLTLRIFLFIMISVVYIYFDEVLYGKLG